ncbi:serine/threonine-protein kinase HipA [Variovorax boronicumulans]|nr:serine/threonine-protein kinase HipA [Variovorax boronicumulans]
MNPVPGSQGLKLNVSEADNAMDLDLARSVAPYFRISKSLADEIVTRSQAVVQQWPKIANSLKIRAREQERMAAAFRLAG